jgi:predicted RNase H-like HicB family nuclease
MKFTYPAYFRKNGPDEQEGYEVAFPDLPGCFSWGETLADAIIMGAEAGACHLSTMMEYDRPMPTPTPIEAVVPEPGCIVSLVVLDLDAGQPDTVKKTIEMEIPVYLDEFAKTSRLNISELAIHALSKEYQQACSKG